MVRTHFFMLFLCVVMITNAQDKKDLLIGKYTYQYVDESAIKDNRWIAYPSYQDRTAWLALPAEIRQATIAEGEKYLNYDWPAVKASMYLEFTRKGNRSVVDRLIGQRKTALQALVLAELMEGDGRFLDDLINGIFSFCEQTYWGSSAHFYLYGFDLPKGSINNPYTVLPDEEDPIIDLMASDAAANLAWTWYFFHTEFDKISPVISRRLKSELQNKILTPYYEREDLWWMNGWKEGSRFFDEFNWTMNNWTAWITSNMLQVILLMEENPEKKTKGIYKTMRSINDFMNTYHNDGACSEGPSYWGHAGGKLFNYLHTLKATTQGKIDIFDEELVRNIGRYIYRVYISNGMYYVNFSNANPAASHNGGHIYRFGKAIEDPVMQQFGAFLLKKADFGKKAVGGEIGVVLENLFHLDNWQETAAVEPLLSDFYFPDSEIVIARDQGGNTDGFYFAAWGGDNSGGHNHNDIGSCVLYFNGEPVLIDIGYGVGSTENHTLPLINGYSQMNGRKAKSKDSRYANTRKRVSFSTDISGAYPDEAKINQWIRSYTLQREKRFVVKDQYRLTKNTGETKIHFITASDCKVITPGVIELKNDGFTLQMKYNPSWLDVTIEVLKMNRFPTDKEDISKLVFTLKNGKLSGDLTFEVSEI